MLNRDLVEYAIANERWTYFSTRKTKFELNILPRKYVD